MGSKNSDGTLWMWGHNVYGQLGLADNTNRSSPTQVGSDTDWGNNTSGAYCTRILKAIE